MSNDFAFTRAIRKSIPMLISLSGTSGSGKTYSALLLAAGLAGQNGKVALIDTENGRGSMYADSPGIIKAFPNGFSITQMDPPFEPARYIAAISAAEKSGANVIVVDSTSHEWEGTGGCCEIAEKRKMRGMPNWSLAKMEHKKFLNHCLSTSAHLVFCLRAREKVKIVEANNKTEIVPMGIQPIAEKNFVFEMLLSLQLDEQTHFASPIKVPEPLVSMFPSGHLITWADGERIRQWNETGSALEPTEQLRKRARAAAEQGSAAYLAFFTGLLPAQKKLLIDSGHAENKALADQADRENGPPADLEDLAEWPDQPVDEWYKIAGVIYRLNEIGNYTEQRGKQHVAA